MAEGERQIGFQQIGLASVLRGYSLSVPLHQREYSWGEPEITALFRDLSKAIADSAPEYFLGSLVVIPKGESTVEVVDGQQRLATAAILLAAIRDYLRDRKEDEMIVRDIEDGFLMAVDRVARERVARLRLNVQDAHFFESVVLKGERSAEPSAHSHKLIQTAVDLARNHVHNIVTAHDPKNHGDVLNSWISYLEHRAIVVLLIVPSAVNAYRMFETLNDRGLKTSQSDLVKNYFFSQAGVRLNEAQQKWAAMRAVLESFEDEDVTINFLRQMLISLYGHTRQDEVYETAASKARGASQSIGFLAKLETGAIDYAAILNPEHEKWSGYPRSVRRAIATLCMLKMRAMRPVLLSVARTFNAREADRAFRLVLNVTVRMMIAGGAGSAMRSGAVEEALAAVACAISDQRVKDAPGLLGALEGIAPKDPQFQEAFASCRVSQAHLARYYLRSLEMAAESRSQPFYLVNDDGGEISLEHVLPRVPGGNWPKFSAEEAEAYYRRLGNMLLLQAKANSDLKSGSFSEKRQVYAACPYELTKQVGSATEWTAAAINARQQEMARLAPRTWPLVVE
jgi:hypothetical protein